MKHIAFLALAIGTLAAPAYADGKAAIKPPVVTAPAPLQHSQLRGAPQNCCTQAPVPAAPRVISRTVSSPDQGLRLDDSLIASMTGGVGTGVSDVFVGGGSGFGFSGSTAGRSFGSARRFAGAQRSISRGRSSGRRGGGRR
ncbi:MAG: hypothetical protein ABJG15_05955 [Hyphomonadaceae bacterium]